MCNRLDYHRIHPYDGYEEIRIALLGENMTKEANKVKQDMGTNTTLFIKGKRSKKDYLKRDDQLHARLFRVLKKKK